MKRVKKATMITGVAILVSVFSLALSFGFLGTSNASKGISVEEKEIWKVNVSDVSTIAVGNTNIIIDKEPFVNDNKITYGMKLSNVNDYGQFQFEIKNDGNVDAKVANINITGIEGLEQYIDINITNLEKGTVIEKGTLHSNIKVITTYKNQMIDENMLSQSIDLKNISIEVEFEK